MSPSHTPTVSLTQAKTFDHQLEGLRGLAALMVVLSHVLSNNNHLDPGYELSGIWQYTPPGHLSVLVFFILSGYVIGITNKRPIDTTEKRWAYLKKRLVRLYPIYLVAVIITLVVAASAGHYYGWPTIGLHLVFGQVAFTPVIGYNQPLWSLGFEVAYYVFFLALSAFQWRADVTAAIFLLLGLGCRFTPGVPPVLVSYLYGGSFWLLGVVLAIRARNEAPMNYGGLLALLLLFLAYSRLNLGISLIERSGMDFSELQLPDFLQRAVSLADFTSLLFCIPLLSRFTNRDFPGLRWLERLAFVMPALYAASYLASGKIHDPALFNTFFIPFLFYLLALIVYLTSRQWNEAGLRIVTALIPLGSISYGIYIIHFPLIPLFEQVDAFSGTGNTFLLRMLAYLLVVLLLGWFLEKKLHPKVKAYFG
jgi:peptidoglycan/LPS O-acetylase OafA/YrhL